MTHSIISFLSVILIQQCVLITKTKIYLPKDYLCNTIFSNEGDIKYYENTKGIPNRYMGLDIGYKTIHDFNQLFLGYSLSSLALRRT